MTYIQELKIVSKTDSGITLRVGNNTHSHSFEILAK